ncbi:DUF4426 domain-containing protein [Oleiagrimonas sp. MCCC 1A03011]|uniref:DUF4426 domain-containing protein n=1 Tax=Oleiagrimonas sp. MCCC 1A03011 TaxID=1926883 RepID=UPI000DC40414|nr:DUF4426 domain-containing protein [Oleiagrimonas sp. MCCC 1A03011]RAP58547.1 hypothetical protein BTJ49_06365 [Oleiagrimonas sp. MCCC 1A03011]
MRPIRLRNTLALIALGLLPLAAIAGKGVWTKGDLKIRYNALPATALPAASAKQLGVAHDRRQGLLNVLITRGKDGTETSLPADITARAMTENGSPVRIRVREVKDDNGISYLGTFTIRHSGTLRFDLDVTPRGAASQHIQFQHTFAVD